MFPQTARNLSLQPALDHLRTETSQAFSEAEALKARWAELEREQAEAYHVCLESLRFISRVY